MALIFLCSGWLTGIYLGLAYGAGADSRLLLQEAWPYLAALAAVSIAACFLGRGEARIGLAALVLTCAVLGIWRGFAALPDPNPSTLAPGKVAIHGIISDRPEPRDAALQFVVSVDRVERGDAWEPVSARVLVRTDRFEEWAYGDAVLAYGDLRPVEGSSYWAESLSRQGVYSTMEYARLQRESSASGLDPMRAVNSLRDRLQSFAASLLPEPHASLLSGILVGGRTGMPSDFRDALNLTSTSHLVAVSGFNVTVVAGVAQLFALRFFARRKAALLALAAVWAYALLTGLPPSAVRAAIMATMSLASVILGRDNDALSFLLLSAAAMTLIDPMILFDLGFQLSFLATAGLILVEPVLRASIAGIPGPVGRAPAWLVSSLTVTLSAQLATLPLLATTFHTISLVSPLTNLLLAPALTGLMVSGSLAIFLGSIAELLGRIAAPVAWLYLTYMVEVISRTSSLPSASVTVGSLGLFEIGAYYLVLISVALWPLPELRSTRETMVSVFGKIPRLAIAAGAVAVVCFALLSSSARADGILHVYFLDAGHGDATLIRTANGRSLLVDGGPSPSSVESALGRHLGFLDRGLDAVVLTGYGQDRLTGLMEVARRHDIGLVLQPGRAEGSRAAIAWAELVAERQLPVRRAEAGQRIDLGDGSYLEVLWVSGRDATDPEMAVALVSGGTRILLPGDLPPSAWQGLAGSVEVLRVPRHGAAGALDDRFLGAASPRIAVLSIGANNRFGHPSESTLRQLKGSTIFRTDRNGTIELAIDRNGYEVYTER